MDQGQGSTPFPPHQAHPLHLQLSSSVATPAPPAERPLEDEELGLDLLDDFAFDFLSDWDALVSPAHANHAPQPAPGAVTAPGPALTAACEQHVEELLALDPCLAPAFFDGLDALFGPEIQHQHQHQHQHTHVAHAHVVDHVTPQTAGPNAAVTVPANQGPVPPPPAPRPMPYLSSSSPLSFSPTCFFSDDEDCDTTATATTRGSTGKGQGAEDEGSLDTRNPASYGVAFSSSCTMASADTMPMYPQDRKAARPTATSRRARARRGQTYDPAVEAPYAMGSTSASTRGKRRDQRAKGRNGSSSRRTRGGDLCKQEPEEGSMDVASADGVCYSPAPFPVPCPVPLDVLHNTKVALPLVVRVLVVGRQFGNTHPRQTVQALQQATRPLRSLMCFVFDVVSEPLAATEMLFRSDVHMVLLASPTPTLTPEHHRMAQLFARLRPHTYLIHLCPHPSSDTLPPLHASLCAASLTAASLCAALTAGLPHVWPRFAAPVPTPPVPLPGPLADEPSTIRRARGPLVPRKLASLAPMPPQWATASKRAQPCQPYNFFAHTQDAAPPRARPPHLQLTMHQRALAALRALPGFRPIAPLPATDSTPSLESAKAMTSRAITQLMGMQLMQEAPQRLVSGHTVSPATSPAQECAQSTAMCM